MERAGEHHAPTMDVWILTTGPTEGVQVISDLELDWIAAASAPEVDSRGHSDRPRGLQKSGPNVDEYRGGHMGHI